MRTLLASILASIAAIAASADPATVADILASYRATQEAQKSCILKSTTTRMSDISYSGEYKWCPKSVSGKWEHHTSSEFRFDGDRYSLRLYRWGNVQLGDYPTTLSESNKDYLSIHYTGSDSYQYQESLNLAKERDRVIMTPGAKQIDNDSLSGVTYAGGGARGYLGSDKNRIDAILAAAPDAHMSSQMESVNGSPCYVVEASTKYGAYKVWFDPKHGHNIAKAEVVRREGDIWFGEEGAVQPGVERTVSVDVTGFEAVDGIWVPTAVQQTGSAQFSNGDYAIISTDHKVSEALLNPDHDALGSFVPDDIRDGALVLLKDLTQVTYTWQDGKLVPEIDDDTLDDIDNEIAKLAQDIGTEETVETASETPAPPSLTELLAKYRATKKRIGAFAAKGKSEGRESQGPTDFQETSDFAFDLKRIRCRIAYLKDGASSEGTPYKSLLWDGSSLTEYVKSGAAAEERVLVTTQEQPHRKLASVFRGAALMGLCPREQEFIDALVEKASGTVRDQAAQLAGGVCYIVDAHLDEGMCSIWFDSSHGYNIARIEISRTNGLFVLENVRFEDMNGVWVPMSGDMQLTRTDSDTITKWHYAHTEIDLNPDLSDPVMFAPDDIPDGVKASVSGDTGEYLWKDGKPVRG